VNRSRFDIIEKILIATKEENSKTGIRNHANLNFGQLQEYLSILRELNLLTSEENGGITCFKTTEKGFVFLDKYQEIQKLLNIGGNDRENELRYKFKI
jgi:predicted transcriptional regulator